MPIVELTYGAEVPHERLLRLAEALPHAVSLAVECPEEPYDRPLEPGDVDLRFRPRSSYDRGGLDVVVEVRSKWFPSRAETRQARCDRLRDAAQDGSGVRLRRP
jgi:hypothetical protein